MEIYKENHMNNIKKEEIAEKYFEKALEECLSIRAQRKQIYGNCWFQEDGVEANFWGGIVNKFNRIKTLHKKRNENNEYESYEDTLRDLVVLTLFTLACVKYEKENK